MKEFLSLIILLALTARISALPDIQLSDGLPSTQGTIFRGALQFDQIGAAVNYVGDLNNDTIPDFAITAAGYDSPGYTNTGVVWVIYGNATGFPSPISLNNTVDLSLSQGFMIKSFRSDDVLGNFVGYAGDLNNDKVDDMIIGGYVSSPISARGTTGAAYVIYGKPGGRQSHINITYSTWDFANGFFIIGNSSSNSMGYAGGYAGDVNKDSIDDVVVTAASQPPGGVGYVIYGQKGGYTSHIDTSVAWNYTRGFRVYGNNASSLGIDAGTAGDFNNDTVDDIMFSSSSDNAAWVIYGKLGGYNQDLYVNTMNFSQGFAIFGGRYGSSGGDISYVGDFNHDGLGDIIIGDYNYHGIGGAQVFYGKINLNLKSF